MKTQQTVLQSVSADQTSASSKPYTPVSFDDSAFDIDSVVSGAVLAGMLGFICMLLIGCIDAGLIA